MRAFEAVGRLGGIRRAAEALGVTHAIVSRHVAGLEQQLGVTLFNRRTGQLTGTGQKYHQRIAAAIRELGAATQEATARRDHQLTIFCAPGLALHWLTARLPTFQTKDGLVVDLRSSDRMPDLEANEADGDIRYMLDEALRRAEPNVRTVELARPPVMPYAAPQLAEVWQDRITDARSLTQAPLIEENDATEWRLWFAAQGIDDPAYRPVARYGHAHLALAAARAGQGIALANPFLVAEDVSAARLVPMSPTASSLLPVTFGAYVLRAATHRWRETSIARFRHWLEVEFNRG